MIKQLQKSLNVIPSAVSNLLLVSTLFIGSAQAFEKAADAKIYQLMDKTGATRTIQNLPSQMVSMGQQLSLTAKNPDEHKAFMDLFISSIDTDVMLNKVYESILANTTAKEVDSLLTWTETPLAAKVLAAEQSAMKPNFEQDLMRYMADLQANPPTQERTNAILSYVEKSQMVEQGMKVAMSVVANMFDAFKAMQPESTELHNMLDGQIGQMETMMRPAFEQQMVLSSYYIYQEVSNVDLQQYGQFYQTELGKRYMDVLIDALSYALDDWGKLFASMIIKEEKAI